MIQPLTLCQTSMNIWIDTSGLIGCGTLNTTKCCLQLKWPEHGLAAEIHLREEKITFKELLPIALACAVWAKDFCCLCVTVHCDNLGTVAMVNSGYSRETQNHALLDRWQMTYPV